MPTAAINTIERKSLSEDLDTNQKKRLADQTRILNNCHEAKVSLFKTLESKGMTYDDLVYVYDNYLFPSQERYHTLNDFRYPDNGIPLVSFFSGGGGLDLGFEAAGFQHIAAVEHNELFCSTLRHNRPNWHVIGPPNYSGDVSDTNEVISNLEGLGVEKGFAGVFIGGPPCQPFSIAANQRFAKSGENFKRTGFEHETNGNLLFDFIKIIDHFRPHSFLIENVTGLLDVDGGKQLSKACNALGKIGYAVNDPYVVDASEHYIPQSRTRLFVVGSRGDGVFEKLTPAAYKINCIEALNDLEGVANHQTRKHQAGSVLRYRELKYGGRDKLGRVDRLDPNLPSKTVIAGGTGGGGRSHLHPLIPRTLSARESARLQTFPDDYVFLGPSARQFTQVGNAVPPVLAAQLARKIYTSFFG